ncbi:MAG: hypothetical protein GY830_02810 [Bacteroidetes bacterium]|nr:hypothetical protein [Bacteroidota bacterium]
MKIIKKDTVHPLAVITKTKNTFLKKVAKYSIEDISKNLKDIETLRKNLEFAVLSEKRKIEYNPYDFDPKDDKEFWGKIDLKLQNKNSNIKELKNLLNKIINRYVNEIYSPYSRIKYKLLKAITTLGIKIVYKPFTFFPFGKNKKNIFDYANIIGNLDLINKLSNKTTMVLLPTHSSNFDSLMAGTSIFYLNNFLNSNIKMPVYGAGFNLFEYKVYKYWISECGMYNIDRRKKNRIYLDTLRIYYESLMMKGCNSLFYPRGGRGYDGSLETTLKYGLLGTPFKTQKFSYEVNGKKSKKIILVPLVISYESIFEAESLIKKHLDKYLSKDELKKKKIGISTILRKIYILMKRVSGVRAVFGKPMDVLGNLVDENGDSYDKDGNKIDLYNSIINKEFSKEENLEFLKSLEDKIIKQYHKFNYIFTGHIFAKAAFNLIEKKYNNLSQEEFWKIDYKKIRFKNDDLKKEVINLETKLSNLKNPPMLDPKIKKIKESKSIEEFIQGLGAFHEKRPLVIAERGLYKTENLKLLFYYANRLKTYDI